MAENITVLLYLIEELKYQLNVQRDMLENMGAENTKLRQMVTDLSKTNTELLLESRKSAISNKRKREESPIREETKSQPNKTEIDKPVRETEIIEFTCEYFMVKNVKLKRNPKNIVPLKRSERLNFKNPYNIRPESIKIPATKDIYIIKKGIVASDFRVPMQGIYFSLKTRKLEFEDPDEFVFRFLNPYIIMLLPIRTDGFIKNRHIYALVLKKESCNIYIKETLRSEYTIPEYFSDLAYYKHKYEPHFKLEFTRFDAIMMISNLAGFVRIRNSEIPD